ncbi:MAG: PspC domain-containing protein [Bacteroidetes bacterium]|nr:PspC domain-containing protein [Bacteroidota bacterium]
MEQNRLYRSQTDSVIAGVCGGLGHYLNTDPILFRVLFALAVIVGGSGILVYIVLWIVIPVEPVIPGAQTNLNQDNMNEETKNYETGTTEPSTPKKHDRGDGNLWGGLILITLGAIFLIDRFVPRIDFGDLWPVILIVVGVILISKAYQQPKK